MRLLLFLVIVVPAIVHSQINRSATELAKENIRSYLTEKLFKHVPYEAISYGELKAEEKTNANVKWIIVHKFKITETEVEADKRLSIQKPYDFIFYLDDKMEVVRARSYIVSE